MVKWKEKSCFQENERHETYTCHNDFIANENLVVKS